MFKFNSSSGQVSRLFLVLGIVILVAVIIVFLVMKMIAPAPKPVVTLPTATGTPSLVFQKQVGDIQFVFQSGLDKGVVLTTAQIVNNQIIQQFEANQNAPVSNLNASSGGKYIEVTVGAQNEGLANISQGSWDLGNVVDSQGRNFLPLDPTVDAPWIPVSSNCGALLLPALDPVPCTKIYEISNKSTGLKIAVQNLEKSTKNAAQVTTKVVNSALIDITVK